MSGLRFQLLNSLREEAEERGLSPCVVRKGAMSLLPGRYDLVNLPGSHQ